MLVILGLLLVTSNPTGYSYLDYVLIHPWAMDIPTVIVGLFGGIMVGVLLFLLSLSWKSTEILGKLIYLVPFSAASFVMFILDAFSNPYYLYGFSLVSFYLFILWGMAYPRLKLSMFKARNIDDLDAE